MLFSLISTTFQGSIEHSLTISQAEGKAYVCFDLVWLQALGWC